MTSWLAANEDGSVTPLVILVAGGLVFVAVALVYDGSRIVAAHVEATDVAQAAVRTGTQNIDLAQRGASSGPQLRSAAAAAAAESYIATTGHDGNATVSGEVLSVTVSVDQPLVMLPPGSRTVTATANSEPVPGEEVAP